ncbi:amino acid ABC transporter substrate-binding protein [Aurantimonas sp. C2-6-R+9]|uniref:amino acid ABC transporter substrate-binding protein n=1 Tax=unclassified Aurantimonas TaxID=2638230 RepID=UPI002E189B09|nr:MULTISPECIES: amino acid ABC transporter substrate-binding protein [unclassified Aurantimonas]MEC5291291.1 amino acid ABC transporter substrate-binding protein [Aurantimonas sp. C2-3-R2]MEC5324414.1 amino acid ABC transporter substrate-binding protein [Aurantimonas sp. A3-2-R12]MEC5381582.1 amino acid ABC transporter substrate-binding protein [Aurantimonas sp. C2-6-R+9]MEC5412338.1 amino acid ABC transporter substrate-binding protein [Aurantimonas sp. C2-4-R8]
MKLKLLTAVLGLSIAGLAAGGASAQTLQTVKDRGALKCGVNTGLPGFASQNDQGAWQGLDVDYCKAIAAAVFGDPSKVQYSPLSAVQRFPALQNSEVDVLARNTTWTMDRDTKLGLTFAGVNYYDGQGFMVKKELNVSSALELSGATVCVQSGTTTELNLADFFRTNNMEYNPVVIESQSDVNSAYDSGRCDVLTTDASGLAASRLEMGSPDDHAILPEIVSKEPLGPAVRQGDTEWLNVVKWTHYALLNAEELGVTQANVEEMLDSENPEIRRLLGKDKNFGESIGVSQDWVVNIIKAVGNYGEIFERNIGVDTPLKIQRGQNALWTKGGLQYGMPVR